MIFANDFSKYERPSLIFILHKLQRAAAADKPALEQQAVAAILDCCRDINAEAEIPITLKAALVSIFMGMIK